MIAFTAIQRFLNAGAFDVETGIMRIGHTDTAMHLNGFVGDEVTQLSRDKSRLI